MGFFSTMGSASQGQSVSRQAQPIRSTTFHEFNGQKGFNRRARKNRGFHVTTGPNDSTVRIHDDGTPQMSRFNLPAARDFREQT